MKKKTYGAIAAALVLGLTSCSDDNPWMGEAGQGAIKLTLTADGSVKDAVPGSRAEGSDYFEVPSAEKFSIELSHADGTTKVYPMLDDFKRQESFKTGSYTLRAFYGRIEEQGFNLPCFEGLETVNVLEGRTTEVSVHARVTNSLVSVTYTDEFKDYLSNYSTTIQSSGYDPVKFIGDEAQPAFIAPGEVTVTVSFTNPQGQSVTIQPASFMAKAGVHHVLKYNVNGSNAEDMQFSVMIDEALEEEIVEIDLTEELFTAPAPVVNTKGFEPEQTIEFLAGASNDISYRFNVISHGGLSEVVMKLASNNNFTPEFGGEINLLKATETQQNQLKALGFDIKGLFRNPDKMAIVDFTDLPQRLPAGEYTLTLQAKDMLTRSSLPVSVKLTAVAPTIAAEGNGAVAGLNLGSVMVDYNGTNPKADITFEAKNGNGMFVTAPVKDVVESAATRSIDVHRYNFTIGLPDTDQNPIQVKVYLYGEYKATVNLEVTEPTFTLSADAFAKKAWIKVTADDEDLTPLITASMRLIVEGDAQAKITERVGEDGLIMLEGLKPQNSYTVRGTLLNSLPADAPSVGFTTETEDQIPEVTEEGNSFTYSNVDAGGVYYYNFLLGGSNNRNNYMQNATTISFTEPKGWTTINKKTCYPESTYANSYASSVKSPASGSHTGMNTWYCVPSTFLSGNSVTLRSVAHDPNGQEIELDNHGITVKTKYSEKAPSYFAYKSAGELFLGTFDFNGNSETKVKGVEFATRPSSLEFDYSYEPVNGEYGFAEIAVYDSSNALLAQGSMKIGSGSGHGSVELQGYKNFGRKAAKIYVGFRSTEGENVSAPVPASFVDVSNTTSLSGNTIEANKYKSLCVGSVLNLSNIKLNY